MNDSRTTPFQGLRERAEQLLQQTEHSPADLVTADVAALIHDLSVHQVELEMQNEELRQTQQKLQSARDDYQNLYQHAPAGYLTLDAHGMILRLNQTFVELTGLQHNQLIGRALSGFLHEDDRDIFLGRYSAFFKNPREKNIDVRFRREDGELLWVRLSGRHNAAGLHESLLLTVLDITREKLAEEEQHQLQRQLVYAQKLESLGVLAGGIAHDFNNILQAIIGNVDLALMRTPVTSPATDNLHSIGKAAARAAELAGQMLAYSGRGKTFVQQLDLNLVLEEMLNILNVSISKMASLHLNFSRPLPAIEADATQLRQVIMNLVINASEAIGDMDGTIAISTGAMVCDHRYLKDIWLDGDIREGRYVYLEVADSGCGMNKETLGKIFDPFFTTKFTGRGLGMAAMLGIVRGHKGAIKITSSPGNGSTFRVLFPALTTSTETSSEEATSGETWKGSGTVLLVDDEETVREIGSEMLRELGYEVITATDGLQALELFRARNDISFVVLDLTMPHMDGVQCFHELRLLDPALPVIMSSGYSRQEVAQKFVDQGLTGFIQKPYRFAALQEVIRTSLGTTPP